MMKLIKRTILIAALFLSACSFQTDTNTITQPQAFPMETSFWWGPYEKNIKPDFNIAYPDPTAVYWSSKITIPEGARLELLCKYAHARYLSINAYDMLTGAPTDSLNDVQTVADAGSSNPFLPGAERNADQGRDFTITVLNDLPPENPTQRQPNALYARASDQGSLALVWRIYASDKDYDITGGVGLPEPRLILADGTVLENEAACAALSIDRTPFPNMPMPAQKYAHLRSGAAWKANAEEQPEHFPALKQPRFAKVFDVKHSAASWYTGVTHPTPPYHVAQYANLDNQYLTVQLSRGYGEVAVIRGKSPITPRTYQRTPLMDGEVQMRYWSLTTNESLATTRVTDGTYDEQVPLDDNGFYTVAVSLEEDRPKNSFAENRVKWLDWGEQGDGAGNPNDGFMIYRHMLPSTDFTQAIQNITKVGDEERVLGEYFPKIQYMSRIEFEGLGSAPWQQIPY